MLKIPLVIATLALPALAGAAPVPGTTCSVLPANDIWNTDISTLPVHAQSAAWLSSMGAATTKLHPDFGPSPYGMPFAVVDASHAKVTVDFDFADESDPGPYPFGADIPLEGGGAGDSHAFMIDKSTCNLYELYAASWNGGSPTAGSGAIFNLGSNALRPNGWTSADAAGLPIFPGLVRLDEVNAGSIRHAIRFTAQQSDRSYLWPARHQAGSASNSALPPMGARFRLKASFSTASYSTQAKVILTAMQHYGLILADNGSNWFFQGTQDAWPDSLISELKTVPASAFEAVDESSLQISADSGQARSTGGGPAGTVTPTALAFGNVVVGQTTAQTLTLTSTGSSALTVGTATVTGTGFAFASDACSGTTLAVGATCAVSVRFAPTTTGARSGTASLAGSQVALSGTGTSAAPVAQVTPTSLTFASTRVGQTSAAKTVTVKNTGAANLVVSAATLAGAQAADYVVQANGCGTVAPNASCTITLAFRPTATGTRTAELDIADNAAGSPQRVTLTATGRRRR